MNGPKRITYDSCRGVDPAPGDVLVTKTGRAWLVLTARRVRSKVARYRWALTVQKVEHAIGARRLPLAWYVRGRKRTS